ncbi:hypothetical protein HDC90_000137 [Pedobacter sp. AK013]|uniref:hypothetical protein n=1 Tax=Pedobacter sp. AK013 TaxID=2723071 RepID=UPI001618A81C|nr:hypothetical protein [Pedobacter sp. AK013]MBB6235540.1 hypothetical protein [Pedobacter sp. AK013]
MKTKYLIFSIAFILILSCQRKNDQLNEFIINTFPDIESGNVLVLPGSGCSGCISDAENSIDSLLKTNNYKIIFCKIQSLKTLKNRLRDKRISFDDPNILIDTADNYIKNSVKYKDFWSYPTHIVVKNRVITEITK